MAKIRVNLDHPITSGEIITFKAPCDCTAVTGMKVYYPNDAGESCNVELTFMDSHGNNLAYLGNLFSEGAVVVVATDWTSNVAHILNADTNGYLENKMANSGGGVFTGTGTYEDQSFTLDNTYTEFSEAFAAGKIIRVLVNGEYVFNVTEVNSNNCVFVQFDMNGIMNFIKISRTANTVRIAHVDTLESNFVWDKFSGIS